MNQNMYTCKRIETNVLIASMQVNEDRQEQHLRKSYFPLTNFSVISGEITAWEIRRARVNDTFKHYIVS